MSKDTIKEHCDISLITWGTTSTTKKSIFADMTITSAHNLFSGKS